MHRYHAMEQDEHSNTIRINTELREYQRKLFTICSSRFRVSSSNSALICLGSRSCSVVNERRQRFFGKYQAPYRYFLGDC